MSKNPRDLFLKRFEGRQVVKRIYGQSFYELNSTAILYFRYSKAHGQQFFFGVESDDVSRYKDNNLFVLFICENEDEIIVIPVEQFLEMVNGSDPISNQWKIIVSKKNNEYNLRVAGKGKYNVTGSINRFDFRPIEFRSESLPSEIKFSPLGIKKDKKPRQETEATTLSLEDRLVATSSDSKHPTLFEKTVTEAFGNLGFKVRHIGGAGKTDILIELPFRGIIDCKSSSDESLSQLNFSRLKRHKIENNASFLLVVGKGFDRAVVRDAVMEKCTLMPVKVLRRLTSITENCAVSPFDIEPLLKKGGLVSIEDCSALEQNILAVADRIESVMKVISMLDFKPRALKEIKGRLDYENEDELQEILSSLCSPVFSIAAKVDDNYFSRYSQTQSIEKLKQVFKGLISPSVKD